MELAIVLVGSGVRIRWLPFIGWFYNCLQRLGKAFSNRDRKLYT